MGGGDVNDVVGPVMHGPSTYVFFFACAPVHTCRGYGSDMMAHVAVVCAIVLLLRLGRFPEPDGCAELRPQFRVSAYTLDALKGRVL